MKIAVFVSGGGTNLQAIIDKIASGEIRNVEIAEVIASNNKAYAIERAKIAGIPSKVISKKELGDAYDEATLQELNGRSGRFPVHAWSEDSAGLCQPHYQYPSGIDPVVLWTGHVWHPSA